MREAVFRHWQTNLSSKTTANWVLASNHSRGGRFHSSAALFKTKYSSFIAASSFGKSTTYFPKLYPQFYQLLRDRRAARD